MQEEDIGAIITYQIKYSLTVLETAAVFHISSSHLGKRLNAYCDKHPDIKPYYEALTDRNSYAFYKGSKRG